MTRIKHGPNEGGTVSWEGLRSAGPLGHLLSNGQYRVLLTAAGSGFSECSGQALTRWRGDRVEDADGMFVYLRDLDRDLLWSAGHQPVRKAPDHYEAAFSDGRAAITRRDEGIESILEVAVVPDRNAELRRLTLRNLLAVPRRIEVTSYLEAVLNHREADAAHPAFSKLFVQTEWSAPARALLARRRPRGGNEAPRWMFHWLGQAASGPVSFESDRARFLGRGRTVAEPQALTAQEGPLSGGIGNVLDPVLALRSVVTLQPGESLTLAFGLGYADSREEAMEICARYSAADSVRRAFLASEEKARKDREGLGVSREASLSFTQVAVDLMYGGKRPYRQEGGTAPGTMLPAPWGLLGGSADPRLLVVPVSGTGDAAVVDEVLCAHAYWTCLGFQAQVAFLGSGGFDEKRWAGLLKGAGEPERCVFINADRLPPEARLSLLRHARLVLGDVPRASARRRIPPHRPQGSIPWGMAPRKPRLRPRPS